MHHRTVPRLNKLLFKVTEGLSNHRKMQDEAGFHTSLAQHCTSTAYKYPSNTCSSHIWQEVEHYFLYILILELSQSLFSLLLILPLMPFSTHTQKSTFLLFCRCLTSLSSPFLRETPVQSQDTKSCPNKRHQKVSCVQRVCKINL